jgi:hypothetical protein
VAGAGSRELVRIQCLVYDRPFRCLRPKDAQCFQARRATIQVGMARRARRFVFVLSDDGHAPFRSQRHSVSVSALSGSGSVPPFSSKTVNGRISPGPSNNVSGTLLHIFDHKLSLYFRHELSVQCPHHERKLPSLPLALACRK